MRYKGTRFMSRTESIEILFSFQDNGDLQRNIACLLFFTWESKSGLFANSTGQKLVTFKVLGDLLSFSV